METAASVTEAIAILEREGYRADFSLATGTVHCAACDVRHDPAEVVVLRTFRFEGDADPGDEAIVLGVECPACGQRGIIVSAYGPEASQELIMLVERARD